MVEVCCCLPARPVALSWGRGGAPFLSFGAGRAPSQFPFSRGGVVPPVPRGGGGAPRRGGPRVPGGFLFFSRLPFLLLPPARPAFFAPSSFLAPPPPINKQVFTSSNYCNVQRFIVSEVPL
ncbi:hypothetical protein DSO57_1007413 [Entomophthora muscae]|uniref:Uncharacterized protein n=1 Tax=Entomophthora muscae TaxID=34485 RepID=A0ACC2SK22_9FUNG|nr:hypothetical protein DSO57_1007413 [Entomophthora muscae]